MLFLLPVYQRTLISASLKKRRFSGLASANPRGSKFFELGSGPSAPLRPPANSIDGVARTAVVDPRDVSREFEDASAARAADGATKASVEPTMARTDAAKAVFIVVASCRVQVIFFYQKVK